MSDEFPAICDSCCGPDKHIKMMRQANGEECKVCTRPFTVFRWNPNNGTNKSKKTIICMTCARARNCCQSCMLDITYGIPLEIRDTALKMAGLEHALQIKSSNTSQNREVKAIMADKQEAKYNNEDNDVNKSNDRSEMARDILLKLSEKLNGNTNALIKKAPKNSKTTKKNEIINVKNADISKILGKLPLGGLIVVPETTPELSSFFLFGFSDDIPQYIISDFCNKFGKIKSLSIVHRAKCGYVVFTTRKAAESFATTIMENGLNKNTATPGLLILNNKYPVRVSWGKQKPLVTTNEECHKLSLVITKVMRQLAEKDKIFEDQKITKKAKNHKTSSDANEHSSNTASTQHYKALRPDFEL